MFCLGTCCDAMLHELHVDVPSSAPQSRLPGSWGERLQKKELYGELVLKARERVGLFMGLGSQSTH